MKKIIVVILIFLVLILITLGIYKLSSAEENVESENKIVTFSRNIPTGSKKFEEVKYEVDFSNNKVKKYKNNDVVNEYELSADDIEWLKVSIAHCFENEEIDESDLKKQNMEYYIIKVDDTVFVENRIDRVNQANEILEK